MGWEGGLLLKQKESDCLSLSLSLSLRSWLILDEVTAVIRKDRLAVARLHDSGFHRFGGLGDSNRSCVVD